SRFPIPFQPVAPGAIRPLSTPFLPPAAAFFYAVIFRTFAPIKIQAKEMPKLSRKAAEMPESPIRKLMPYAVRAKAEGKHIYHLHIGQPDSHTPGVVLDGLKNVDRSIIESSPSEGFAGYRKRLAAYYERSGISVKPEEILVTTGGSE